MAISQRLVALMGGDLRLDSELGRGSRFHFSITLPVAPASADDDEPAPATHAAPLRALVVDDNPTAREVLERMGQALGWTVDVASGGEQALGLLQARATAGGSYQAVFVDCQMPGLDGWQTSQRIRELGLNGEAPVVAMVTAHGREMLGQRSAAEQALLDGFLVKPITASLMFDALVDARAGHEHPHPSRNGAAGAKRLAGLRLLVAEDNPNNQQVARELLEDEGALAQIAQHGQEAVAVVAAAPAAFDVVLMDLQMPIMDGFTATAHIRKELGLHALPIVARTANAMASDREGCLAAGMNDHIGKPFDLGRLVRVLRRQAGRPESAEAGPTAGVPDLPQALAAAARAAEVDVAGALNRMGGRRDVYLRMLRNFVADLGPIPHRLQAQAAAGERAGAAALLHTLKGLAATLGAGALSAAAALGEKQLAAGSDAAPVAALTVADAVCAAIAAATPALRALAAALQADQPVPAALSESFDPGTLQRTLAALAEQLANADMAASDTLCQLQSEFGAALAARLEPMVDAIGRLDFESALRLCNALEAELPAAAQLALAGGGQP